MNTAEVVELAFYSQFASYGVFDFRKVARPQSRAVLLERTFLTGNYLKGNEMQRGRFKNQFNVSKMTAKRK